MGAKVSMASIWTWVILMGDCIGNGNRIFITIVMCYSNLMILTESKLTSQGQISIPTTIRKKLGLVPGSVIEWGENEAGEITVKRSVKCDSEDIHKAIFEIPPKMKSLEDIDAALRTRMKHKYSR